MKVEPVSFTATLLALGQLEGMEVDIPEGLAFAANVFNIRTAAKAFRQERTFHSGPVFDAAPDLLAAAEQLLREVEEHHHGGALPAEDRVRAAITKARGTP